MARTFAFSWWLAAPADFYARCNDLFLNLYTSHNLCSKNTFLLPIQFRKTLLTSRFPRYFDAPLPGPITSHWLARRAVSFPPYPMLRIFFIQAAVLRR
jgi:hypothetical protein